MEDIKKQAHKEFDERYQISDTTYSFDTVNEVFEADAKELKSFIDSLLDKAVQSERDRIVKNAKKHSSYFKRQVSEWGDSYTDTVKGITEEDLLYLITNESGINKLSE